MRPRRNLLLVALLPIAAMTQGCAVRQDGLSTGAHGRGSSVPYSVRSPDGKTTLNFALDPDGRPRYSVHRDGRDIIASSSLGIALDGTNPLAAGFRVKAINTRSHDSPYELAIPTKVRHARDRFHELEVRLEEAVGDRRELTLVFRAYDDGIALRYVIPEQPSLATFAITDELSTFSLPADAEAHALPLKNFTTPYENYYTTRRLGDLDADALIGLPLLVQLPKGPWLAITEADLINYAGMYLRQTPDDVTHNRVTLRSALSPLPKQSRLKVRGSTPFASPWRVLMIADEPGTLIESTLLLNLNPPSKIADTSWIHTGKIAFPWWNGYVVPTNAPFKGDVNTETLKYYIDFCHENGIEFASIDGNIEAWYGGPNTPWLGADVTKPRADLELPAVLDYAKSKGVRIRLWMHWEGLRAKLDEALATYERWGIDGIMIDFMDRDDQEMVNFYHEVAEKAAKHHLTVNYHGAYKPTGMERTWPNVMNYEAALNLEYNKWTENQSRGSPPAHELMLPFTRMLAGPIDFHSGGMRSVKPADFNFQNLSPLVMGTRSRQLARYVVYENPLPMLSDDPASYRGATGFDLLKAVPTTWDETRVLEGVVGDLIVVARRHGDDWWLGAMNAESPRKVIVPLTFLGKGTFAASGYADDVSPAAPATAALVTSAKVTSRSKLTIEMAAAGGGIIRIAPVPPNTR